MGPIRQVLVRPKSDWTNLVKTCKRDSYEINQLKTCRINYTHLLNAKLLKERLKSWFKIYMPVSCDSSLRLSSTHSKMNAVDALYAVTRLNWPEARNDTLVMEWWKRKVFAFPVVDEFDSDPLLCDIDLPLQTWGTYGVPESILIYIFGLTVLERFDEIPPQWIHYIRASLASLVEVEICECCKHLLLRHEEVN